MGKQHYPSNQAGCLTNQPSFDPPALTLTKMTKDTITPARLSALAAALYRSCEAVESIRVCSERGDIPPATAAKQIKRIMDNLQKYAK